MSVAVVLMPDLLLVEPGAAGGHHRGDRQAGVSAAARVTVSPTVVGAGEPPAGPGDRDRAVPVVAVADAVSVSTLLFPVAEGGAKAALTPLGRPLSAEGHGAGEAGARDGDGAGRRWRRGYGEAGRGGREREVGLRDWGDGEAHRGGARERRRPAGDRHRACPWLPSRTR